MRVSPKGKRYGDDPRDECGGLWKGFSSRAIERSVEESANKIARAFKRRPPDIARAGTVISNMRNVMSLVQELNGDSVVARGMENHAEGCERRCVAFTID